MSWQTGAFIVLAAVLLGGFAWYERSRPPSQVVALVAALAALAVAGRLAFAAIPNVVATTDIVLLTGYAIGAAPGFAVGALAGLVSNFWLGQGPWTPWQMAGWGLAGVFGAALAAVSRRRLGRLPLAIACAFAGIAYGALLNFSLMVTYGGEQSLDRFAALSVRAIPFDLAHAGGNFALAVAAGPAMVRMLVRFRERFEVRWVPASRFALIAFAVVLAAAALRPAGTEAADKPAEVGAAAGEPTPDAVASARGSAGARAWLARAQNRDGGFGADLASRSDSLMTGWACLGLEAAGLNPLDLRRGGHSPIGYLRRHAGEINGTGDLERTILVLRGAGLDPRRFAGRDLVSELRARRRRNGSFGGQVNLTAFGILALRAAGSPAGTARSAGWLRRAQNVDRGWGFARSAPSDTDSTGAALQAIAAAGRTGLATRKGVAYLRDYQLRNGGFSLRGGAAANSQSTAWAVQGLLAVGRRASRMRREGNSPFDYLASRQASDGHYRYSSSSDQTPVWVTAQVLLAVERKPFPLRPVARRPRAPRSAGAAGATPIVPAGGPGGTAPRDGGRGAGDEAGAGETPARGAVGAAKASGGSSGDPESGPDPGADSPKELSRGGKFERRGWYGVGGLGALAAALAGGWFVFRRRLI